MSFFNLLLLAFKEYHIILDEEVKNNQKEFNDDLKTLFQVFIDQSRQNIMLLRKKVQKFKKEMTTNTTESGKIYHT